MPEVEPFWAKTFTGLSSAPSLRSMRMTAVAMSSSITNSSPVLHLIEQVLREVTRLVWAVFGLQDGLDERVDAQFRSLLGHAGVVCRLGGEMKKPVRMANVSPG